MNVKEYIPLALRTAKFGALGFNLRHAALGLITETGEFATTVKRLAIYNQPMDEAKAKNLREELGDIQWYAALALASLGLTDESLRFDLDDSPEYGLDDLKQASIQLASRVGDFAVRAIALTDKATMDDIVEDFLDFAHTASGIISICDQIAHQLLGVNPDDIRRENVEKLLKRYPAEFTNEAAEARADKAGEEEAA